MQVLSGEKQRIGRNYDMSAVTKWFAERSDLILLLFDAHKLDISDELKHVIENLRGELRDYLVSLVRDCSHYFAWTHESSACQRS